MKPSIQRTLFLAVSLLAVVLATAAPQPQTEPWNMLAEREGTYLQCTRPDSPYGEILHFLVLDEAGANGQFFGLYGAGAAGLDAVETGARLTVTTRGTPHDIWPISYETVKWKQTGTAEDWPMPETVLTELADHGVYPADCCGTYLEAVRESGGDPVSLVLLDSRNPGNILEISLRDAARPLSEELDTGDRVALILGPPGETGLPGAQVFRWCRIAPQDGWTPPPEVQDALARFELTLSD